MCSLKNEVRLKSLSHHRLLIKVHGMMKNLASNCLGGLAFWAFGWGLSMGRSSYSTAYFGFTYSTYFVLINPQL